MASVFALHPISRPTVKLNIKIATAPVPPVARCIPHLHCSIPGLCGAVCGLFSCTKLMWCSDWKLRVDNQIAAGLSPVRSKLWSSVILTAAGFSTGAVNCTLIAIYSKNATRSYMISVIVGDFLRCSVGLSIDATKFLCKSKATQCDNYIYEWRRHRYGCLYLPWNKKAE